MSGLRTPCRVMLMALAAVALWAFPVAAQEPPSPDRQILVMVNHPPDHFRPNASYGRGYADALGKSARTRLARRIAAKYGLRLVDEWPMPLIGLDCFVMLVPDGRSTSEAATQVSRDSAVAWAQPVGLYETQGRASGPNDPLFAAEPAAREWHLADLHRIATGRGVKVAVVDSGIDAGHPDLSGQLLVNRNFVAGRPGAAERHGTGVAGIIAAKADNGVGIAGIAPGAKLLGLRACWQAPDLRTVCDSFSLAKALYYAIQQRAGVINLSLGGPDDRLLRALIKTALNRGTAVVTAFDARRPGGGFPASMAGVTAVSDAISAPRVYTAPGRDIPTTQPGGRWFLVNGSSFAAAHVSGLVALIRQRARSSAVSLVSPNGGAIDACASVIRVSPGCECNCGPFRAAGAR
ncbi:MAG TPA: S8 family serine peptidase [Sphingomicrobium sp.]|nr:S8 family serine peptidase [Sphingomicrobium sp.]